MRKLTGAGEPVSVLLRTDSPDVRTAERGMVTLINTGTSAEIPPPLDPLSPAAGAGVSGPLGADGPPHYVALGDSYTAGPLVPSQTGSPAGCLRSLNSARSWMNSSTSSRFSAKKAK